MSRLLTEKEFEEIKSQALFLAINAERKSHVMEMNRFTFRCESLGEEILGNARNILSELIAYVKTSYGRVEGKDHWIREVKTTLYKLKMYGVERAVISQPQITA